MRIELSKDRKVVLINTRLAIQDLSKNELHDVINQLIYLRYILIEGHEYPVLKLSTLA